MKTTDASDAADASADAVGSEDSAGSESAAETAGAEVAMCPTSPMPQPSSPPSSSPASRTPLDPKRIADLLHRAGVRGITVEHVVSTGSTNADLSSRVAAGTAVDRTVLLAEEQVSGRGRLDRPWSAPAGSQFIGSMVIAPGEPGESGDGAGAAGQELLERVGELPLLVGVAAAEAVRELGVPAVLKWPNDLQVIRDGVPRKLAGILVEAATISPLGIVLGIGLNVSTTQQEFEDAGLTGATSLLQEGVAVPDLATREEITATLLRHLFAMDEAWRAGGSAVQRLRDRYRELSSTLSTRVRAELPGGKNLYGTAVDLGPQGELIIETNSGAAAGPGAETGGGAVAGTEAVGGLDEAGVRHTVTAGDVVHLRPDEREN